MARAVRIEAAEAVPLLRGREHFWSVLRKVGAGKNFTVADIQGASNGASRNAVRSFIHELVDAGVVETIEPGAQGHRSFAVFRLTAAPARCPAASLTHVYRAEDIYAQLWNTMRAPMFREGFSAPDLAAFASTDDVRVNPLQAGRYVRALANAGYLVEAPPSRWRLRPSMAGPEAPLLVEAVLVFDPNRNAMGDGVAEMVPL